MISDGVKVHYDAAMPNAVGAGDWPQLVSTVNASGKSKL